MCVRARTRSCVMPVPPVRRECGGVLCSRIQRHLGNNIYIGIYVRECTAAPCNRFNDLSRSAPLVFACVFVCVELLGRRRRRRRQRIGARIAHSCARMCFIIMITALCSRVCSSSNRDRGARLWFRWRANFGAHVARFLVC